MVAKSKTVARHASRRRVTTRSKSAAPIRAAAKPAAKPVTATKVAEVKTELPRKEKKLKVVRDSFTMPQSDYDKIAALKKRCLTSGASVKKSELLRAGLHLLERLGDSVLMQEIAQLENVKTGRPAKHELNKKTRPGKKQK